LAGWLYLAKNNRRIAISRIIFLGFHFKGFRLSNIIEAFYSSKIIIEAFYSSKIIIEAFYSSKIIIEAFYSSKIIIEAFMNYRRLYRLWRESVFEL
jgi:hypothetical protein